MSYFMNQDQLKSFAKNTIHIQAEAIGQLVSFINQDFMDALMCIHQSKGRMIISGIGKSAIIAQKIVATMNSTGTPAVFMHAADAIHGDMGMIANEDVLMIISKSGESPEIKALIPFVQKFGNKIIALCGNEQSFLAKEADWFINTFVSQEACPNNLAPTTSTTAQMVMGDALAMSLLKLKGFNADDFAKYHPGGTLGKQLYLKMEDLLEERAADNYVYLEDSIDKIIYAISNARQGATAVLSKDNHALLGIITDGDLRRFIQNKKDLSEIYAKDLMSKQAKTISSNAMAMEGVGILKENKINQLIVLGTEENYLGMVHMHEMMKEGLV